MVEQGLLAQLALLPQHPLPGLLKDQDLLVQVVWPQLGQLLAGHILELPQLLHLLAWHGLELQMPPHPRAERQ